MKQPPHMADTGHMAADWDPLQACLAYVHKLLQGTRKPVAPAARPTSFNEFAARVAQWARAGTGARGAVMALAMDGGPIVCVGRSGLAPELGARLDRGAGISGKCVRSGEPQLCSDTAADQWADLQACAEMGIRSVAMVPLRTNGAIAGLLGVFSDTPGHFDRHHLGILRSVQGIVTEELQRRAEEGAKAVSR